MPSFSTLKISCGHAEAKLKQFIETLGGIIMAQSSQNFVGQKEVRDASLAVYQPCCVVSASLSTPGRSYHEAMSVFAADILCHRRLRMSWSTLTRPSLETQRLCLPCSPDAACPDAMSQYLRTPVAQFWPWDPDLQSLIAAISVA